MKHKLIIALVFLLNYTFQQALAEELQTQTDSLPQHEAAVQKSEETPTKTKTTYYFDAVSEFDATINDINLNSLVLNKKNYFSDELDDTELSTPELKTFYDALGRFTQANIPAAYKGFKSAINDGADNDYYYMFLAYKLSELGLFNLSKDALSKIEDMEVWGKYADSLNKYYFPKNMQNCERETTLAEAYTDIVYNNMTHETINSIFENNRLTRRSDYANYIIATGFFIEKNNTKALNAINRAISINPYNINYQLLKTRILCEEKKYKEATSVIKTMKNKEIKFQETTDEIEKLKFFVLSQSEKNPIKTKYYLAYYFYLNNELQKAQKELNILAAKNKNPEVYNLLGQISVELNETDKALEYYKKNIKAFKKVPQSYIGCGNINTSQKKYQEALSNYTKAAKLDKKNITPLINIAIINLALQNEKNAKKYCNKLTTQATNDFRTYYLLAKLKPEKKVIYLKQAQQSNPFYPNTLLDLTDNAILNKNLIEAKDYLNSVKYIKEKTPRYYYYTGVFYRMNGENEKANVQFNKATELKNKNEM